jgi:hypothetical protein
MEALNLDTKQPATKQLCASAFPEPADVYLCDKCGRDVTVHLHRGRAHVRQPLGPVRYFCRCGQDYLSGATEWDYLSDWEKRQWLGDIPLIFILFAVLAGLVVFAYFALVRHSPVMILLSVAGVPFAAVFFRLFIITSAIPFEIAASRWRTRASPKE